MKYNKGPREISQKLSVLSTLVERTEFCFQGSHLTTVCNGIVLGDPVFFWILQMLLIHDMLKLMQACTHTDE